MFVLSSFIIGYLFARAFDKWGRVPVRRMVTLIVATLAIFATVQIAYEFWSPWPGNWDYAFYRRVVTGRHRIPVESGVLAFLLGFAIYLLRSRVMETLRKAGLVAPKQGDRPKARSFP